MNIELKPIAESKVRQLGGEVFGVVIRDKRGRFAAITEMGFVTWLDEDKGGEYAAYLEGMNSHLKAELEAARAQGACEWAEQLDACEFHGNDHEVCAEYSGQVPCARAQSGQGAEPVAVITDADKFIREGVGAAYKASMVPRRAGDIALYTHPQSAQQGSVPEGWKLVPVEPTHEMRRKAGLCRGADFYTISQVWNAMLSATPQSEGDGWVRCDERLPTEEDWWVWIYDSEDGDIFHALWRDLKGDYENGHMNLSHWMPTGLKRPQPPKEGA
jgi:hypothetical protein